MAGSGDAVEALVARIGENDALLHAVVQAVRQAVRAAVPGVTESVKYGGVMFEGSAPFGGVFAYKGHVSLEFSRGCDLDDPRGVLEGSGKFRRHIKLQSVADVEAKHLRDYAARAAANARAPA
ncbi:DUF1801 domain-containing protein [Azospirillum agricola]|uniref:DUF1801 domain-containing protein n=1 Tax=Azospirillum agricola TaxID=1720247 RepID=UPI000A0F2CC1|nr:DUF1801 domain-containing protein [Azospirillum agricola]SMH53118.1 hypothetical protein SAMN02982994_3279 [Azospirillum lipoferum]